MERLRQASAELPRLRSQVETLRSQVKQDGAFDREVAKGFVPQDWFAPAGYADAWSAHESALKYLVEGNFAAYLDSFTPEGRAVEQERIDVNMKAEGKTEAELGASWAREAAASFGGFRVLSTNVVSSDEVVLRVQAYSFDGASRIYRVKVTHTGNAWKLTTPPFQCVERPERAGDD